MSEIVVVTYDWVPETPRGFVRDIRARWALEEAALAYRVETTPFKDRGPDHFARQPFGQAPWLIDGDVSTFESGAMLLHIAEKSEALMPRDARGRSETVEWIFAALNSVEMASLPWSMLQFMDDKTPSPFRSFMENWLKLRLDRMETVLAARDWLAAGRFTVADLLMADVLRLADRFDGLCAHPATKAYVDRLTARPAFAKAHADQMAHFAKAD
jgi:glutathione S-transferase